MIVKPLIHALEGKKDEERTYSRSDSEVEATHKIMLRILQGSRQGCNALEAEAEIELNASNGVIPA